MSLKVHFAAQQASVESLSSVRWIVWSCLSFDSIFLRQAPRRADKINLRSCPEKFVELLALSLLYLTCELAAAGMVRSLEDSGAQP